MTVTVTCDGCGAKLGPVWSTISYSPGGGRHGTETWHFCFNCVPAVRTLIGQIVPHPAGFDDPHYGLQSPLWSALREQEASA